MSNSGLDFVSLRPKENNSGSSMRCDVCSIHSNIRWRVQAGSVRFCSLSQRPIVLGRRFFQTIGQKIAMFGPRFRLNFLLFVRRRRKSSVVLCTLACYEDSSCSRRLGTLAGCYTNFFCGQGGSNFLLIKLFAEERCARGFGRTGILSGKMISQNLPFKGGPNRQKSHFFLLFFVEAASILIAKSDLTCMTAGVPVIGVPKVVWEFRAVLTTLIWFEEFSPYFGGFSYLDNSRTHLWKLLPFFFGALAVTSLGESSSTRLTLGAYASTIACCQGLIHRCLQWRNPLGRTNHRPLLIWVTFFTRASACCVGEVAENRV